MRRLTHVFVVCELCGMPNHQVRFIKAVDVAEALSVSRSSAYAVIREAGALRVGKSLRLSVAKLRAGLGDEAANAVLAHAAERSRRCDR